MLAVSDEARDALHARDGRREVRYQYELIRGGVAVRTLDASGTVTLDNEAELKRTARFTIRNPDGIDWLNDLIRPSMSVRLRSGEWERFPLGLFIPSTPTRRGNACEVEAYDRTVLLREDCVDTPLYLAAGTRYLDAVGEVLVSAGVQSPLIADPSETVLPADREFEAGSGKLQIINTLLREINYNSITCNAEGKFVISRYVEPGDARVGYTYAADELSALLPDTSSELDAYGAPNVFRAVCSNPDLETEYHAVFINDNPASRLSTAARGRRIVSALYQPDAIASQEALDAYVRRIAFRAAQVYEEASFETLNMPLHENGDVLNIRHPDLDGLYEETGWSMDLETGIMSHTVRKLVML